MFALIKKEKAELDSPGEDEEETEEIAGVVKITGEEAKGFIDYIKKLVEKKKEGQ